MLKTGLATLGAAAAIMLAISTTVSILRTNEQLKGIQAEEVDKMSEQIKVWQDNITPNSPE
jgi:hypothetical protein